MIEISPLRRRMIDDMTIRNLSPATQYQTSCAFRYGNDFKYAPSEIAHQFVAYVCKDVYPAVPTQPRKEKAA